MSYDELVVVAKATAKVHGLEPALLYALVEQESAWNTHAIRYEPVFYKRYVEPLISMENLTSTEAHARSFSWGLCQVMGQVAREYGFEGSLARLCEPQWGLEIGAKILASHVAHSGGDVERALLRYNGGGNKEYAKQVLARMSKYSAT